MKYVFGPVPSRRLGRSLGIDPVPLKTCNWNCVYCQLGRSSPLVKDRCNYFPPKDIVAEVETALSSHSPDAIDWLTFAGSGEPTLHASLGWMIEESKTLTEKPIAVITNGSLLHVPEVRRQLLNASVVLPSLDAGSEQLYQRIDRPAAEFSFTRLVEGLIAFRKEFAGKLWLEVMLIKGLNDSDAALEDLASVIRRVSPDKVYVNLPVRPPTEISAEVPDDARIARAKSILGTDAEVVRPVDVQIDLHSAKNLADSIMDLVKRHPMSEEGLIRSLRSHSTEDVSEALARLASSGRARVTTRNGERYWSDNASRYVTRGIPATRSSERFTFTAASSN